MKIVVVPDVHLKIDLVKRIEDREGDAVYSFLGDLFDDFGDNESTIEQTARWLQDRFTSRPDDIFHLGNHDAWYLWPDVRGLVCSGNEQWKAFLIRSILDCSAYWDRVRLWSETPRAGGGTWLLSHAGFRLDNRQIALAADSTLYLDHAMTKTSVTADLSFGHMPLLLRAGRARMGQARFGGVTWLDWNEEFVPIEGVNQIVGHTVGKEPRNKQGESSDNWCLDTNLKHYGVIEDGVLTVKTSRG